MSDSSVPFKIDWSTRSKLRGPGERSLGDLLLRLRNKFAPKAQGISISYVDDRAMRRLNREHRGLNQTTDVLSFPSKAEKGAFPHLGDLVISLPVAEKMAKKLGVSRRREVETLVIHGFLHLCGHDHEMDKGQMMALQAQVEKDFLGEEPLRMSLKRGRKPGSKVKKLKDGSRVVVTGRAAQALVRKEKVKKEQKKAKPAPKPKKKVVKAKKQVEPAKPKRGPGRPRKVQAVATAPAEAPKKVVRRKRPAPKPRSGVLG
ncbi:MAG: rRNA maturation RNase YbeY [Firmicutes bacterium]|nr:rRNA maturation RNase YbeY [Bacillota bacterium]